MNILWVMCHGFFSFMGYVSFFKRIICLMCHFYMVNVSKNIWVMCSCLAKWALFIGYISFAYDTFALSKKTHLPYQKCTFALSKIFKITLLPYQNVHICLMKIFHYN